MIELPVDVLEPVSISGPGFPGFLLHHRSNLPPSLILDWGGSTYCFYLEGNSSNRYFEVKHSIGAVRGLLIREPIIVVDITSRYDTVNHWGALGSVVIEGGALHIVGSPVGNGFADPVSVPLWQTAMRASSQESVGFTRWSLGLMLQGVFKEIWRQSSVVLEA